MEVSLQGPEAELEAHGAMGESLRGQRREQQGQHPVSHPMSLSSLTVATSGTLVPHISCEARPVASSPCWAGTTPSTRIFRGPQQGLQEEMADSNSGWLPGPGGWLPGPGVPMAGICVEG